MSNLTTQDKTEARKRWALQAQVCNRLGLRDRVSFMMDLESLKDLDLERLLGFPEFDFKHDCFGIMNHMDRSTYPGKLMNCFEPRCGRIL